MTAANSHPVVPVVYQSRRWPLIIVGLLAGHFVLMMTAVFVITHGNHDSLIRDDDTSGVHAGSSRSHDAPTTRLP